MGKLLLILFICFSSYISAETITFGIVPQQSPLRLAEMWIPLIEELEQLTGYHIHFATNNTIPEFENSLANSSYDIAFMNPLHFLHFNKINGYEAIARENKPIYGIIVAPIDSNINSIEQLNDKDMVFPAPNSFAATILILSTLNQGGIHVIPHYVSSHDSVYLNVANRKYNAGGGVFRTYNVISDDIKSKLKIIYETPKYTSHAFAIRKGLPKEIKLKLITGLLHLSKESLNNAALTKLVEARYEDWNNIQPFFKTYQKELNEE